MCILRVTIKYDPKVEAEKWLSNNDVRVTPLMVDSLAEFIQFVYDQGCDMKALQLHHIFRDKIQGLTIWPNPLFNLTAVILPKETLHPEEK